MKMSESLHPTDEDEYSARCSESQHLTDEDEYTARCGESQQHQTDGDEDTGRFFVSLIKSSGYQVKRLLGGGAFGQVFQCMRLDTKEMVAVKAIPHKFAEFGEREVGKLEQLRQLDQEKSNLMKLNRHVELQGNVFLEFEELDMTLEDLISSFSRPLQLSEIQVITQQVLVAVNALKSIGMVHTDIKMDNIMLINHELQPFKVKLIDFGMAHYVSELCLGDVMQVLHYRAPEVILGLPLNHAIDMWALGCIMAEMYIDGDFGSAECELGRLEEIVQFHGQPDDHLLKTGIFSKMYFYKEEDSTTSSWKLKTECNCTTRNSSAGSSGEEHRVVHQPLKGTSSTRFNSLNDIVITRPGTAGYEDTLAFLSLLKQMLQVDPQKRITPGEALGHPFITMDHFPSDLDSCPVRSSNCLTTQECHREESSLSRLKATFLVKKTGAPSNKLGGSLISPASANENPVILQGAITICVPHGLTAADCDNTSSGTAYVDDDTTSETSPDSATHGSRDKISTDSRIASFIEVRTKHKFYKRTSRFFSRLFKILCHCTADVKE